ncbi:8861_t:CDS:10 [Ambispora leptoticha]|uniref:8861_t:CDS:1 n=1 Tax=Ambispora leptoticha TaxID=144679 RepID=A0A9N8WHX8_9GLOM|nr:8861_t:CDS:10 [Ambispora leptoticha]
MVAAKSSSSKSTSNSSVSNKDGVVVNDLTHLITRSPPSPKGRGRGRNKLKMPRSSKNNRRSYKSNNNKSKETGKMSSSGRISDETLIRLDVEAVPPEYEEKPREERPYTDFFPDLDLQEPLNLDILPAKEDMPTSNVNGTDTSESMHIDDLSVDENKTSDQKNDLDLQESMNGDDSLVKEDILPVKKSNMDPKEPMNIDDLPLKDVNSPELKSQYASTVTENNSESLVCQVEKVSNKLVEIQDFNESVLTKEAQQVNQVLFIKESQEPNELASSQESNEITTSRETIMKAGELITTKETQKIINKESEILIIEKNLNNSETAKKTFEQNNILMEIDERETNSDMKAIRLDELIDNLTLVESSSSNISTEKKAPILNSDNLSESSSSTLITTEKKVHIESTFTNTTKIIEQKRLANGHTDESKSKVALKSTEKKLLIDYKVENSVSLKKSEKKLPVPSFRRVDVTIVEQGQDSFDRPEGHYLRYLEPTEMELADRVEYDMDEQDLIWLNMLNSERKKEELGEVSPEEFEAIMDRLEKEWFDLTKNIPKAQSDRDNLQPEDSACAICDDAECENSNAIVFCDGCNLAVHQDCYGIPYIPEGQWLCRKCMISPENPVSCIFCPNEGGAFKQTTTNHWAHLLCGIWIPEVTISNAVYMEPIDNINRIPRSRWRLMCYICRQKMGACIQCENKHCFTAFHPTCARKAKLCMKMKSVSSYYDNSLKAYCDKHTPREYKDAVDVSTTVAAAQAAFVAKAPAIKKRKLYKQYDSDDSDEFIPDEEKEESEIDLEDEDEFYEVNNGVNKRKRGQYSSSESSQNRQEAEEDHIKTEHSVEQGNNKAARAYNHSYSASAPIAPAIIMQKLLPVLQKSKNFLRKKGDLVATICKYWSLKRESRRGAPLLKRLHLEASKFFFSSVLKQTEAEKAIRFEIMRVLRKDIEKVRMLADSVQRREKGKLRRYRMIRTMLETILYPLTRILREALEDIQLLDKQELFAKPVSAEEVPDYYLHIKNPMDFSTIRKKIDTYVYDDIASFKEDLELIFRNAMTYNTNHTTYFRTARRMQTQCQEILVRAEKEYAELPVNPETKMLDIELNPEIFTFNMDPLVLPNRDTEVIDEKSDSEADDDKIVVPMDVETVAPRRTRSSVAKEKVEETPKRKQTADPDKEKEEKKLPKGWVYVSEDEDDEEPIDDTEETQEDTGKVTRNITIVNSSTTTKSATNVSTRTRSRSVSENSVVGESSTSIFPQPEETELEEDQDVPRTDNDMTGPTTESVNDEEVSEIAHGSVVWAKMQGFPWYPAEVEDPSSSYITPEIMADRKEGDTYLVHFFDEKYGKKGGHGRTWKWVPASKVLLLGNDEETDMAKLKDKAMTPTMKKEIPLAYAAACSTKGLSSSILHKLGKNVKLAKSSKVKGKKY